MSSVQLSAYMEAMFEFYLRSIDRRWKKEIALAEESVIFLSPYLTSNTANLVLRDANPDVTRIYTVFSFQNFISGASSIRVLRKLKATGTQLFHLEMLHAKVLIVDGRFASLGSQNLTFKGTRNKEASIATLQAEKIAKLHQLIERWIDEAIPISENMLIKAEKLINPLQKKMQPIIEEANNTEEKYWYDLKLEEMQRRILEVRQKLYRFTQVAGYRSVDEATARLFVRKSAWWLRHPSGYAVRAPNHQYNIYGSNSDWKIDFGANTFLVGRAIQRCLNTIEDTLEKVSQGEVVSYQDLRNKLFYNVRGAVANYGGYEYEGYYSAIEDNDMVFGTQSIDISDFIGCAIELTGFDRIFIEAVGTT